ncbi:hypothetical protein F4559_004892 [Saccharothrix violaceirubra]|uniref:AAA+ ATPase domain-containing protein n=1 Tax=Saccharothrix violaceirubra TaxID=413306 RepID=A0A7W7WYB4_9PSEU|nr:hypothetical protein [Saccharothrix violaceirubra]MBB4967533.1 hypothetical protein [Saccharothrix violaceirubra]
MAAGESTDSLIRHLYKSNVPAPSALTGFEENVDLVGLWAEPLTPAVERFLDRDLHATPVKVAVGDRYRSYFTELAATVPEFRVWSDLGEHAATRSALRRLEELLTVTTTESPRDLRAVIRDVNHSELTRRVVDVNTEGYGIDAVFPTVEDIFVMPRFRAVGRSSPDDLELVLARHFSTPNATRRPLLLLGHPGAGKSLITKIIAARLPSERFTAVRVPLRHVDANTTITNQVRQALTAATHGRVPWPDLVDQSADVIRVLLLDGLDELLQATTDDRSGYLHDIVEFQRVEAAMGHPVAVVVTSRTLVADRLRIPGATPVLNLEEFDADRIRDWVRRWNAVNFDLPFSAELALRHEDLAGHPLLLLMLALYYADPTVSRDEELSTTELYERLFVTYARREVTKQAGRVLSEGQLAESARDQVTRLSTAALGMFNRGRQDITEADLSADLKALDRIDTSGERVLAEFFFVHAPEAQVGETRRGYEFVHATFGEYLVAARVVDVLRDVAEGAYGRRKVHDPEDDLLRAMLSHQPLCIREPVLEFARDLLSVLDEDELDRIRRTLETLLRCYRTRPPARAHTDYSPQEPDLLREMATYAANLVLLRVHGPFEPPRADKLGITWPDLVNLWRAALTSDNYLAMLDALSLKGGNLVRFSPLQHAGSLFTDVKHARLTGDRSRESLLRTGLALNFAASYLVIDTDDGEAAFEWTQHFLSWLDAAKIRPWDEIPNLITCPPPPTMTVEEIRQHADRALAVVENRKSSWPPDYSEQLSTWSKNLKKAEPIRYTGLYFTFQMTRTFGRIPEDTFEFTRVIGPQRAQEDIPSADL